MTVGLFSLAAFLLVLALLGSQLRSAPSTHAHRTAVVLRRIYKTTVVERVVPAASAVRGGTSVSQSVSGSSAAPIAAPVTRTS